MFMQTFCSREKNSNNNNRNNEANGKRKLIIAFKIHMNNYDCMKTKITTTTTGSNA